VFRSLLSLAAGAGVFFVPLVPSTRAESLADAIALAYQSNPTLQSARAQLRALDEDYVQARAGFRATATLQAGPAYSSTRQPVPGVGTLVSNTNAGALSLQLSQPIYTGGRVSDAVDAASLDVAAGREGLRVTEAQVILSVVQAYEDVRPRPAAPSPSTRALMWSSRRPSSSRRGLNASWPRPSCVSVDPITSRLWGRIRAASPSSRAFLACRPTRITLSTTRRRKVRFWAAPRKPRPRRGDVSPKPGRRACRARP